jgi:hypothetical protein
MREPAWLVAAVDQRLALLMEKLDGTMPEGVQVLMTPLTEPEEFATKLDMEFWDKSCDHCRKHCPGFLLTGNVVREAFGLPVNITFGACRACMEAD